MIASSLGSSSRRSFPHRKPRRIGRAIWIVVVILALLWAAYRFFLFPRLAIINGYTAKIACSCTFVSQLQQPAIRDQDLGYFPIRLAQYQVDTPERKVRASLWGLRPREAFYRPGQGCTLWPENASSSGPQAGVSPASADSSLMNRSFYPDSTAGRDSIWPPAAHPQRLPSSVKMEKWLDEGFRENLDQGRKNTRALLVYQKGRIVGERYANGADTATPLLGWSMAKSVTTMLAGVAERHGLWNTQQKGLVPHWTADERRNITPRQLAQMTSGLRWTEDYGSISQATLMLYQKDSMGLFTARQPAEASPGEHWEYSSGSTNLLAYLLQRELPGSGQVFLERAFQEPLGLQNLLIEPDAGGFWVGSSYAYATAREWARMGQLLLQQGRWAGDTLFRQEWYNFMTSPAPHAEKNYGAGLWLNADGHLKGLPKNIFYMDGYHGQRVFVLPSEDMVVVRLGTTYDPEQLHFARRLRKLVQIADELAEAPASS